MVADVAIAGGGPAGSALAIELGRRGLRVNLYERSPAARLKACGEGILPHGAAALEAIVGELPPAAVVRGLRFVVEGTAVAADFPERTGLVVRRDVLHRWLLERAAATPNVDLRLGKAYTSDQERFVVGADGNRSAFHRQLPASRPSVRRVGLSTHMAGIDGLRDQVEVFVHPLGEIYLAPTGGGEALVAALLFQKTFRRDGLTHLLRDIPELRTRSARARQTTPLLAAAPLGLRVPRVIDHGLLLIGDAAGAPDPITGDGLALAFVSVVPAADAIVTGNLESYQITRTALGRDSDRLGRLLLRMTRVPGRAARALLMRPSLVSTLIDVAVARRSMGVPTLLRAVL